jgi:hypothetical protein
MFSREAICQRNRRTAGFTIAVLKIMPTEKKQTVEALEKQAKERRA